jgi:hypothetical protein
MILVPDQCRHVDGDPAVVSQAERLSNIERLSSAGGLEIDSRVDDGDPVWRDSTRDQHFPNGLRYRNDAIGLSPGPGPPKRKVYSASCDEGCTGPAGTECGKSESMAVVGVDNRANATTRDAKERQNHPRVESCAPPYRFDRYSGAPESAFELALAGSYHCLAQVPLTAQRVGKQ